MERLLEDVSGLSHLGLILTIKDSAADRLYEVTLRSINHNLSLSRVIVNNALENVVKPWCRKRIDEAQPRDRDSIETMILPWLKQYSTSRYHTSSNQDDQCYVWINEDKLPDQYFSWISLEILKARDIFTLLMSRPRLLRATLKNAKSTWDNVKGEVNLEDVILFSALQTFMNGKFADFVRDHWKPTPKPREESPSAKDDQRDSDRPPYAEERLNKLLDMVDEPHSDRALVKRLVDWFLPSKNEQQQQQPCQSARAHERYRRRLINRRVTDQDAGDVHIGLKSYSGVTPRASSAIISRTRSYGSSSYTPLG